MRFLLSSDVRVRGKYLGSGGCAVLGCFTPGLGEPLLSLRQSWKKIVFFTSLCLPTQKLPDCTEDLEMPDNLFHSPVFVFLYSSYWHGVVSSFF